MHLQDCRSKDTSRCTVERITLYAIRFPSSFSREREKWRRFRVFPTRLREAACSVVLCQEKRVTLLLVRVSEIPYPAAVHFFDCELCLKFRFRETFAKQSFYNFFHASRMWTNFATVLKNKNVALDKLRCNHFFVYL